MQDFCEWAILGSNQPLGFGLSVFGSTASFTCAEMRSNSLARVDPFEEAAAAWRDAYFAKRESPNRHADTGAPAPLGVRGSGALRGTTDSVQARVGALPMSDQPRAFTLRSERRSCGTRRRRVNSRRCSSSRSAPPARCARSTTASACAAASRSRSSPSRASSPCSPRPPGRDGAAPRRRCGGRSRRQVDRHTRDAASPSLLRLLALLVTLRRGGFRLSAIVVADSVPVLRA
jgi:hypothetical protein